MSQTVLDLLKLPVGGAVGRWQIESRDPNVVVLHCPGCRNSHPFGVNYIRDLVLSGIAIPCGRCVGETTVKTPAVSFGKQRRGGPQSEKAIQAVSLLKAGRSIGDVAKEVGVAFQSVEKWWFRWIVLPQAESLAEEVKQLRSEAAARQAPAA